MKKLKLIALLAALFLPLATHAQETLNEGFENWPPEEWTIIHVSGSSNWGTNTTAHSGSKAASINYATSGHENYLITPRLTPVAGDNLSFFATAQQYAGTTLTIEVSTTTPEAAAFGTVLATYTSGDEGTLGTTSLGTWVNKTIDLSSYAGQNIYIAFHVVDNDGGRLNIDDVTGVHQYVPSCPKVNNLTAGNITTESAAINWNRRGSESAWAVYLNGQHVADVTDSSYTFNTLTANTVYTAGVRAVCVVGDSSSMVSMPFRTACSPIDVSTQNWNENFENWATGESGYDPCWGRYGYYITYLPQVSTTTGPDGNSGKSLYGYAGNNAQPMFVILPEMEDLSNAMIAFQAKTGYTSTSTIQAGYMTDPTDTTTFHAVSTFNLTSADGWKYCESHLEGDDLSSAYHIALRLHNSPYAGYYIYLDDIMVGPALSCARPTALAVRDIVSDGAELFIEDSTYHSDYTVQLYTNDTLLANTIDASDTVVTLSSLTPNTEYKVVVVSNCDASATTLPISTSFRTSCVAIAHDELPWTAHFDSLSTGVVTPARLSCWTANSSNTSYPYISTTEKHSLPNSLLLYGTETQVVAMPSFADELNTLQLSFWLKPYYSSYSNAVTAWVEVGVMSNPNDPATFVAVQTCQPAASGWSQYDVTFANHTTGYIAFRFAGATYNSIYLDDITVQEVPSCVRPSVTVSGVSATSATLTIADANDAGQYTVVVNDGDSTLVDGFELVLDTLQANSDYSVRVRTLCNDGNPTADAATVTFHTLCSGVAIPDTNGFEADADNSIPACWTNLGGTTTVRTSSSGSSSGVHSGSQYLDFRGATRNMIALPPTTEPTGNLQVRFWTRPEDPTKNSCGKFQVGYITDPADTTTFVAVATYVYNEFTGYEEKEVSMAGAPDNALIAFLQKDCSTIYYWFVDDVIVEELPSCQHPVSVSVSDITVDGVTLTVNDPAQADSYRYYLAVNDSIVDSNDFYSSTTEVLNLTGNTAYTVSVATVCGDEVTSTVSTSFRTACSAIATADLPWSEGFETYPAATGIVPCWDYQGSNAEKVSVVSTNAHDGSKSFRFSGSATTPHVAILPAFEDGIEGLMLGFWLKSESSSYSGNLLVGYVTEDSIFTAIDTFLCADYLTMAYEEVRFENVPTDARIAIAQVQATSTSFYWWIDDLTVGPATECVRPNGVEVRNITTDGADLWIDDNTLVNNYSILVVSGNDTVQYTTANDTVATLTGLASGTGYTVYVKALCPGGDSTTAVNASFFTECETISTLPYNEGFENWIAGATGFSPCWDRYYKGYSASTTNHPYVMTGDVHDGSNAMRFYSAYDYSGYGNASYYYSVAYMPLFSAPVNTLTMSFWYKVADIYDPDYTEIYVGVSDTIGDTTTFTRIETIVPTDHQWHQYELDFGAYTGTGNRITIIQKNVNGDEEYDYDYDESYYSSNTYGYIDDITIDAMSSCVRPATLVVSDVDATHATLTWTDNNGTGDYVVLCSNGDSVTVNGALTYTFSNLEPTTNYTVGVRRICGDELSPNARTATFRTLSVPVTVLPYSTGFEAGEDTGWEYRNATTNQWTIDTAAHQAGSRALYISNDGGASNAYTNNSTTNSYAYRIFDLAAGEYAVSFNWRAKGESSFDFLRVFAVPDNLSLATADGSSATANFSGWQDIVGGKLNQQDSWQTVSGTFTVADSGRYKLVFFWRNDNSDGNNPPAAIDNVTLEGLTCSTPSNLVFDTVTSTSVTLSWHSNGTESAWVVSVDNGAWRTAADTVYTVFDLTPATLHTFDVRALCSAGDTSYAVSGSVRTECASIGYADLPWTEDFNAISSMSDLQCWSRYFGLYTGDTTTLSSTTSGWTNTTTAMGGSKHVKLNIYGTTTRTWLVSPAIDVVTPLKLAFDYALTKYNTADSIEQAGSDDRFMVLVTSDNGNSWTPLATWDSTGNAYGSIQPVATTDTFSLAAYVGQQIRIAFYGESTVANNGDNDLHIDNVTVFADSTAPQPTTYNVTLLSADTTMGHVNPAEVTTVMENSRFTATAVAEHGFDFVCWTTAAGTVVSSANPFTFTVTSDTTLIATFEVAGVPERCPAPTHVTASNVTATSAVISWTNGGSESAWTIDYNGHTVNVDSNPYTLTGLTANTSYTVAVMAKCSDDETSEWSEAYTFTTASVGIDDVDGSAIALYPNPASTMVTLTGIEEAATVTLVDMNGRVNGEWRVENGKLTIDVSSLTSGAYFVRIAGEQVNVIRKLIVR